MKKRKKPLSLDPLEYTYNTGDITNNGLGGSALTSYAQGLYPDLNTSAKIYTYMSFKFKCIDKVGAMPFNLFRSSEMYFIETEANCHLTPPKEAEARQLLKELIRDSGRDPQYTCDKSGQALLDEIKFYRRIEPWGEGFSWFDFKRCKDTIVRPTFEDGEINQTTAREERRTDDCPQPCRTGRQDEDSFHAERTFSAYTSIKIRLAIDFPLFILYL